MSVATTTVLPRVASRPPLPRLALPPELSNVRWDNVRPVDDAVAEEVIEAATGEPPISVVKISPSSFSRRTVENLAPDVLHVLSLLAEGFSVSEVTKALGVHKQAVVRLAKWLYEIHTIRLSDLRSKTNGSIESIRAYVEWVQRSNAERDRVSANRQPAAA